MVYCIEFHFTELNYEIENLKFLHVFQKDLSSQNQLGCCAF